ncbi:MAG: hypothetical protein FWJ91_17135, partial [Sphaerobacter thermophilus]
MRKKFLHLALALGLISSLFVGAIAPAAAAPEEPGEGAIYFPWVPNNDSIAGIEGINGSIVVQNLEPFSVHVDVYDAAGNELTSITLNPRASQGWTAAQLGIDEPGSGVIAVAHWFDFAEICKVRKADVTLGRRGKPADTTDEFAVPDGYGDDWNKIQVQGYVEGVDYNWWVANGILYIDWSPDGAEPAKRATYSVTLYYCDDVPLPRIAGAEKHTVGTVGPRTSANTEIVDGYTALPVQDLILATGVTSFPEAWLDLQSRWIIPIAQTNNNWNTAIVITNISDQNNSVNATYYAAGGQGFAGPSVALLSGQTLGPGESIVVDLREDAGFPDEEVGSVWIDATRAVVAMAFRNKPSTEMMLTTVAQPRTDNPVVSPTLKYGPLVFRDYNGWNTGINIANLSSEDNQVSVTYYNYAGNVVAAETRTIPARAMEYVYTPATGNFGVGENQITAVRIQGTGPLAAAIDEVKYLGGQGEGHAMSYAAGRSLQGGFAFDLSWTPLGRVYYTSMLALPLVQKGNPQTGTGDTSGINLFNSDANSSVNAWVQFLDSAGVPVAPTVAADDSEQPYVMP